MVIYQQCGYCIVNQPSGNLVVLWASLFSGNSNSKRGFNILFQEGKWFGAFTLDSKFDVRSQQTALVLTYSLYVSKRLTINVFSRYM